LEPVKEPFSAFMTALGPSKESLSMPRRASADSTSAPLPAAWSALVRAGMVRWPLGQGAQLLGRLGPRNLLELGRLVIQGGSAIADRFASEEARAFLIAPGMHSDLQLEVPGSGAYALIMHLLGERVGMPVPRAAAAA
jgi:phytoene dehydrogenase-like protein